ncbi:MAG TPA: DUF3108 domain-containing protein [Chiayiivirga sp.]|nr:DUF3108 domain-containing protein [Chiayiivirga sp.]
MMFRARLALISLAFAAISAHAQKPLSPYTAEYEVLRGGSVEGRATISLAEEGGGVWRLEEHTRGTQGLAALAGVRVDETSRFRATPEGLNCLEHSYRQTGLRKRERQVDCTAEAIVSRDHRGEYRFAAQDGVIDRQAVGLAIALDLAAGRRGELDYAVIDRESLETNRYQVAGEETVAVPFGTLRALKVERLRENSSRTTTMWFGTDQNLVPVRVRQNEGGGEGYELRLVSLKRQPG